MFGIVSPCGTQSMVKRRGKRTEDARRTGEHGATRWRRSWLSGRVRCKLLYNESIKSLSLIRNSSHVRCARARMGEEADIAGPFTARLSSFSSSYLSPLRLRGRLTPRLSHLRNSRIPNYRLANSLLFHARLSQRVKSWKPGARGRTKNAGDTRDRKKLMELQRNDTTAESVA